jgi:hypothetical protein
VCLLGFTCSSASRLAATVGHCAAGGVVQQCCCASAGVDVVFGSYPVQRLGVELLCELL